MGGGYPQQGYQARPPTSWAPPGPPMQQPGYGYLQPGAYPGSAPQYNMNQSAYPGYPPQHTSGGYASGWDQTSAQSQQTQGGGYDYYGQQQPPQQQAPGGTGAPSDNTGNYGYSQPPGSSYGQGQGGYAQDGYGGYHASAPQSGYGQAQPNPVSGYDQQQGYNSTSGYGNASNPPGDGQTPSYGAQGDAAQAAPVHSSSMGQQGYTTGQQPSPNPNYPSQASTHPGYGVPQTSQAGYGTQPPAGYGQGYGAPQAQKPPTSQPAYGQTQQSPSAQGGYVQPGYPAQSGGYAQPDSGAQRPPASGYGGPAAQPGYGASPYGAPPVSQTNYGQQQAPAYNSGYGAGYPQTQAYSADGSSGGNARATYDSAPASQGVQPSGAAKASPQS